MKYKNIEEVKIGKFSCKIGEFDKGFGFTIFAPDKTLLSRGEKKTKEEILSLYNELISKFNADREANRKSGIPTPIEFVDALSKIKPRTLPFLLMVNFLFFNFFASFKIWSIS